MKENYFEIKMMKIYRKVSTKMLSLESEKLIKNVPKI